tara:strand:- start:1177 stop:1476 length:300 start_codon:yes stop_codon:yes gene_type:complete
MTNETTTTATEKNLMAFVCIEKCDTSEMHAAGCKDATKKITRDKFTNQAVAVFACVNTKQAGIREALEHFSPHADELAECGQGPEAWIENCRVFPCCGN